MSRRVARSDAQIEAVKSTRGAEQSCVCNRPIAYVTCQTCGTTVMSRVQKACAAHPAVIHLMDMEKCPTCFSSKLLEKYPADGNLSRNGQN
uniref:Uncharacterized protein n=1 Tax=Amblyomma aureolatum TaxID=187763 RepID=A0A1E1WZS6_9ACAR